MSLSSRFGAIRLSFSLALVALVACPSDDTDDTGNSSDPSTTEGGSASDTNGEPNTGDTTTGAQNTESGGSTSGAADCGDATDEASCAAAQNLGEGGGCTWMVIHELSIEEGNCNFTTTERGECVGTSGLDDGCNFGSLCDSGDVEAYYRDVGDGTWELAQGTACRGISGFMQCNDTMDEPCTCACEIPG